MKTKSIYIILALLTLSLPGSAGNVVGNGGDHVRNSFLAMGRAVLTYLQQNPAGQALVEQNHLSLESLADALTIEKLSVVEHTLIDNGGSVVDALGEPGSIVLNKFNWFDHVEQERDVYSLVFHEMLRENGVNDDNYVISRGLFPFPANFRISTRIGSYVPLIREDLLDGIFDASRLAYNGSGCPSGSTVVSFDREHNTLELIFPSYSAAPTAGKNLERKNCSLALPVRLPAKTKLVVSLVDVESQVQLAPGSQATITSEAFLAGSSAPLRTRTIQAAAGSSDTQGRALFRRTEILRSRCGSSENLRLNTSLVANANAKVQITGAKLFFSLESCR